LNFLESIKKLFRAYSLKVVMRNQHRKKTVVNLKKAGSVGILFEVPDEKAYQAVHKYIQDLQDMKIRVKALGYVREKHLSARILTVLSFDMIYEKDLNWYGKPKSGKAGEFWSGEYDICINIASPGCFPLKYAANKTTAGLKVGPYSDDDKDYYDVLITTQDEHEQEKFLYQVHEYLSILNPKENG